MITSEDGSSVFSRPIQDLFSSQEEADEDVKKPNKQKKSQEEADTRIILHCSYILNQEEIKMITIKSPDTDAFLLLLTFADKINTILIFYKKQATPNRYVYFSIIKVFKFERSNSWPPRFYWL